MMMITLTLRASMVLMYGKPSRARLSDSTLKKSFSRLFWGSSYDVISTPVKPKQQLIKALATQHFAC
jgi:hypothetical protein